MQRDGGLKSGENCLERESDEEAKVLFISWRNDCFSRPSPSQLPSCSVDLIFYLIKGTGISLVSVFQREKQKASSFVSHSTSSEERGPCIPVCESPSS